MDTRVRRSADRGSAVRVLVRVVRAVAQAARHRLRRDGRADRHRHGFVRRREPGDDSADRADREAPRQPPHDGAGHRAARRVGAGIPADPQRGRAGRRPARPAGHRLVVDVRGGHVAGRGGGAVALATSALGPAIAEPIATRFGARPLFLISAAVGLAGAWFCRRLPPGAIALAPDPAPKRGSTTVRARAIVIGVLAVGSMASAAVSTFVAPFALAHGIAAVRGFFVTYTLTALAVRIGGTRLVDRLGHRRTAFAGAAGYGLVVIALAIAGPAYLIPLGAAFGVVHGIVFPALMALVLGEAARADRPRLLAFANGAINIGIAGLGGIGLIADRVGYSPVFLVTGVITTATAAALLLPARRRSLASASST